MQSSFSAELAPAKDEQLVPVTKESNVLWNTSVSGGVSGNAPPLSRMAPLKRPSSLPPYAIM